jgi:hypothetical protein
VLTSRLPRFEVSGPVAPGPEPVVQDAEAIAAIARMRDAALREALIAEGLIVPAAAARRRPYAAPTLRLLGTEDWRKPDARDLRARPPRETSNKGSL